jgi:hypothetical protein
VPTNETYAQIVKHEPVNIAADIKLDERFNAFPTTVLLQKSGFASGDENEDEASQRSLVTSLSRSNSNSDVDAGGESLKQSKSRKNKEKNRGKYCCGRCGLPKVGVVFYHIFYSPFTP